jgi:hypothetical protein
MLISLIATGKPAVTWTKEKLESHLRANFGDDTVDLFLLGLMNKGTATFNLRGVTITATVIAE